MASCLPIVHDDAATPREAPKIRASKMGKRRAAVLIGVHVAAGLHIAHWLIQGETVTPVEPSEAMAFAKAGIVNAGLIFFAVAILATAVFGRYFCGWGCHLVALQDLCRWLLLKVGIRPRPLRSRALAWVPALAFLYMFVWPVAYRLWVGDELGIRGSEMTTADFWATFPGWVIGGLTFLVCGFVCVYLLGAKGFCTYACPYGAIFAAADRVAPLRIRVTDACQHCGHCTAACTSNVRVHEEVRDWGMVVSPGCMKCRDCISVCPTNALYYGAGPIPLLAKTRVEAPVRRGPPLSWRDELLLAGAFVAAFFTFRGLYGLVPFLMALGVASSLAFLTLTTVNLLRQSDLAFLGRRLKRRGGLLPAGRVFLSAMGVLAVFWLHSAAVRGLSAFGRAPDDPGAYLAKGIALAEAGDLAGAQEVFERGAAAVPASPQLAYNAGLTRALQGQNDAAGEWFRRALALDPQYLEARENLAGALAAAGRFEESIEEYRRALAQNPKDADTRALLARALVAAGRRGEAKVELEKALDLHPGLTSARELLAQIERAP